MIAYSTLDPFTATPTELRRWLGRRYLEDGDDVVSDVVVPLSSQADPRHPIGLGARLELLSELPLSRRLQNQFRTRRNTIGLYCCDLAAALDRASFWSSLVVRLLTLTAAVAAGLVFGFDGTSTALLLIMAWPLTVWRGRYAFPLTALAAAMTARHAPSNLLIFFGATGVCVMVRLFLWSVRAGVARVGWVHSPARFLGRAFLTRALWDRESSSILLAVTKASFEERARASVFIDDCIDRAPVRLRPVLVQCQALVAAGKLEFSEALQLSEQARDLAISGSSEIRGWCALQSGDLLLAAGQLDAAERRWTEAVELLRRSRRADFWLVRAELRLVEAQTADLADAERCLLGLQTLYRIRRDAVRAGDLIVLRKTENYLLRLMHEAGNTVGVVVQLLWEHQMTKGTPEIGDAVADRVSETLLLASLFLDIVEHPERYPDDVQVDESDPDRYDQVTELADNALLWLTRSTDPLLEAQAYAILAYVQSRTGRQQEALGNALESLNVVQRVRYELPTVQWRSQWLAMHAPTYALALELAAKLDAALVAELLEAVRAQSIPLESDRPGALIRASFNALLRSTGFPIGIELMTDAQPVTSDPLLTDRTVLVLGASWVGGDDRTTIDLDAELEAMFPGGWYWSFAKVGDWVYHVVRQPDGRWYGERRPFAGLRPSLSALVRKLPVEQMAGEPDPALTPEHATDVVTGGAPAGDLFNQLFDELGQALIPLRLRDAVRNSGSIEHLVVAPTASLSLVPVTMLSLGDGRRVLDAAFVAHLPSIGLLAQRRTRLARTPAGQPAPAEVLAVLAPHAPPADAGLPYAVKDPPPAERTLVGPLEKEALATALAGRTGRELVLYLAGHVEATDVDDPGGTGFLFADGPLGLHDLYRTTSAGTPLYPIPAQVVLAGCTSLGWYPGLQAEDGDLDAPEWLGLGAAMVHGGAQHVFCTLFDLPDHAHTSRIDRALVDAMRFGVRPAQALRAIQRAELDRWFDGRGSMPLAFLAYAYVGIGDAAGPITDDRSLPS